MGGLTEASTLGTSQDCYEPGLATLGRRTLKVDQGRALWGIGW